MALGEREKALGKISVVETVTVTQSGDKIKCEGNQSSRLGTVFLDSHARSRRRTRPEEQGHRGMEARKEIGDIRAGSLSKPCGGCRQFSTRPFLSPSPKKGFFKLITLPHYIPVKEWIQVDFKFKDYQTKIERNAYSLLPFLSHFPKPFRLTL